MTKVNGITNGLQKFFKKASDNPTLYFATSIVAKDVIGCVMYTSTARANKQYTPEKRSDVANYDLANGVINVALQLLLIKPIDKVISLFVDKKVVKKFINNMDERLHSTDKKVALEAIQKKSRRVKGFSAIFSMILTQYVIKRFIAPYLSMPTGVKLAEMNVIKPKLYEGEEFKGKVGKAKRNHKAEKAVNTQA